MSFLLLFPLQRVYTFLIGGGGECSRFHYPGKNQANSHFLSAQVIYATLIALPSSEQTATLSIPLSLGIFRLKKYQGKKAHEYMLKNQSIP